MILPARRHRITLTLLTALCGFATRGVAQEGDDTIEGIPRHGYFFTSRPRVSLFIYCGFSSGSDQEVVVFQKSPGRKDWSRVGRCNSSRAKGADSIAIGAATTHFIVVVRRETSPTLIGGSSGTKAMANEASNDCGIRLKYSDPNGKHIRLVLLDHSMAFGHGIPITNICDPLLDHYDRF